MDSPQLMLSLMKPKVLAASGQEKAMILDVVKKELNGLVESSTTGNL